MTYQRMNDTLHGRTIRCGNCGDRHAFVQDVKDCYTMEHDTDHANGYGDYYADGPVWSDYGGWVA